MGIRSERTISVALMCSAILHLVAVVTYYRWTPATQNSDQSAESSTVISVALSPRTGKSASSNPADTAPPAPDDEASQSAAAPPPLDTVPAEVMPSVNLNPVPVLREEFSIDMATLALRAPMETDQRESLQTALNHFAEELPEWTDPTQPLRWQDGDREYKITVEHSDPADPTHLDRAVLTVATEVDGLALQARVPVKRVAFSHYAQMVDRWNPDVSLAGDTIVGRFHSNSELFVEASSKPLVTGLTTVAGAVNFRGPGARSQIFVRGLQTRARRIPLPSEPFDWKAFSPGESHVHHVTGDGRLRFSPDGSYTWQPAGGEPQRIVPDRNPWLVIGDEDAELQVEGVIRGSVMVYSPSRIAVTGDLVYARNPEQGYSEDFLGLVSDAYVEIAEPDLTGPGDLDVYAAIYAGRQFRIRKYRNREGGNLRIFGSVTAGSMSATEPRYKTQLEFDPRLEDRRPAHFPMTNRYVLDDPDWDWTVETTALDVSDTTPGRQAGE